VVGLPAKPCQQNILDKMLVRVLGFLDMLDTVARSTWLGCWKGSRCWTLQYPGHFCHLCATFCVLQSNGVSVIQLAGKTMHESFIGPAGAEAA
jgi:hypothetical protein